MTPAALSILTTSFNVGTDRVKALGAWGAMGGFSGVLGGLPRRRHLRRAWLAVGAVHQTCRSARS
jgi:hypothetical protein